MSPFKNPSIPSIANSSSGINRAPRAIRDHSLAFDKPSSAGPTITGSYEFVFAMAVSCPEGRAVLVNLSSYLMLLPQHILSTPFSVMFLETRPFRAKHSIAILVLSIHVPLHSLWFIAKRSLSD